MMSEMEKILILSAPVKSGKTTRLLEWACKQRCCDGILQPVVNDRRHLLHLSTNETLKLESDCQTDERTVSIGKYIFSEDTFDWGRRKLIESAQANPKYLIIDEIGRLELAGKGLEPAANQILTASGGYAGGIILVVRDYLLESVIEKYGLKGRYGNFQI